MKSSESGREAGFLKMGVKLWDYWVMLCYPAGKKTLVHRKEVEGWKVGAVCVCVSVLVPAMLHKAVMGP